MALNLDITPNLYDFDEYNSIITITNNSSINTTYYCNGCKIGPGTTGHIPVIITNNEITLYIRGTSNENPNNTSLSMIPNNLDISYGQVNMLFDFSDPNVPNMTAYHLAHYKALQIRNIPTSYQGLQPKQFLQIIFET